jgi:hypothetical protein
VWWVGKREKEMGLHSLLLLLISIRSAPAALAAPPPPPTFPKQFTCTVEVTAHLVDRTKDYPPWLRVIDVKYDFVNQRASAAVRKGYEEGKMFLRRYDNKSEFMVRGDPYPECVRSYLGEKMPAPDLPASAVHVGTEDIDGVACDHWVDDLGTNRIHIYMAPSPANKGNERVPRRLTDEQVLDGESVPLMTYDWKDLVVGPIADNNGAAATQTWFDIPQPYDWRSCSRYLGGFPYLHIFHHYLRF